MTAVDFIIILLYFIGLLVLGGVLSRRIKSSEDMFVAGKNSSWWLSGLSTYMTIFSAGTFVVWGGVAFRSGLVTVVIGMMLGIASFIVGKYVVRKWVDMGIKSPGEYIRFRFSESAFRFYTIVGIIGRAIHMAVALYAIAIMVVALIPLPAGHILADASTGHLSIVYAVLIMGAITIVYTAAGGFVSVLMTDVVQFAVLFGMVVIMMPLSFNSIGGIQEFIHKAPAGFFHLSSARYSWGWLILWCILNIFIIGGDWSFVQRFISVPNAKQAKYSTYLVGVLYLVTPIIWYIPSMVYRIIDPSADPEQSYMLMSQHILGPGMVGMMLAAMISATLSTVSGTLNVFASVFTNDIFKVLRPQATEKKLIFVGRAFTYGFGLVITVLGILIPHFGGAEKIVVSIMTLIISPLFIPSLWGLFSKKIGTKSIWLAMGTTYALGLLVKFDIINAFDSVSSELLDALIGLVLPVTILTLLEVFGKASETEPGWEELQQRIARETTLVTQPTAEEQDMTHKSTLVYSTMAFKIMMGTYASIGTIMAILAIMATAPSEQHKLLLFATIFLVVPGICYLIYWSRTRKSRSS